MPKQETKIVCPVCGAEFALPEHSHVATGIAIGKDSNLGTISPALANGKTPEGKLEALRRAGVDVSNIFSITDAAGISKLARIEDGKIQEVPDNDPILANIMASGTIPNRRLFRRWVMSQVFHMLASYGGFTDALQQKGYQYQWEMLIEELRVQVKLAITDEENFVDRNRWFNKDIAVSMAKDYMMKLEEYLKNIRVRKCRRRPYVHLRGRNVFKDEITEKVVEPLNARIVTIEQASSPAELYHAVKSFYAQVKTSYLDHSIRMSADFKSAYKGAGAFFTMKNMILFHGCSMQSDSGKALSRAGSMKKLYDKAAEYATEGWRLFGVMKKLIADNNIDIQAKMAEWRKS
jgi:hypothetical protein